MPIIMHQIYQCILFVLISDEGSSKRRKQL